MKHNVKRRHPSWGRGPHTRRLGSVPSRVGARTRSAAGGACLHVVLCPRDCVKGLPEYFNFIPGWFELFSVAFPEQKLFPSPSRFRAQNLAPRGGQREKGVSGKDENGMRVGPISEHGHGCRTNLPPWLLKGREG